MQIYSATLLQTGTQVRSVRQKSRKRKKAEEASPLPPYQATGQLLISDFRPLGIRVAATVSGAETGWGAAAALESVFQSALP